MELFKFKQFEINQSGVAMKVGTDAMVLGAWAQVSEATSILDIGTGTGILALMLAQRSEAFTIDAVEISAEAFEVAVANFEHSPWSDRLFCYHASIQEFADEIDEKYDFIIANPPYFEPHKTVAVNDRILARHTDSLDYKTLLRVTKQLLTAVGKCAFSLPFSSEQQFIETARSLDFVVYNILRLRDRETTPYTRSFIHLGFEIKKSEIEVLTLKNQDHTYTDEYKQLTKDYYLNIK